MAEEQPTTAPEATTETKVDAPNTSADTTKEAAASPTEDKPAEVPEPNPAAAGEQATTDATGPDGQTAEAEPTASDAAATETPASGKGKRKSTGGVPEHKNKKLNKRKSMANLITEAKPGDYFFAKFKGYAPWPSIICDESMLPETLLATRPVSTENSQGELRADYQEGGKNAKDRTYPIMFLETNEFAWIVNSALTPLNIGDTAEDKLKPKMSVSLKNAYALADERHDIDYFKGILAEHQEAEKSLQEELAKKEAERQEKNAAKAARAEKAAENKEKKDKKEKRKSTAKSKDTISDEDDMDVDEKAETETKPSKKRKKDAESDGEGAKPKKTPKTLKLKAEKTPNGANGDSVKKSEKKKKVVSKPAEEEEKVVLTDEQKLERRENAVLYLRHRMQKGFLARDQAPKEEEMDAMAEFFNQLESFTDLEASIIRNTKINKVLKGIVKLASIPKEDEHNFKKRSNDLLAQWSNSLDQNKGETPTTAPVETPAVDGETKTNGDAPAKEDASVKETTKDLAETKVTEKEAKDEAADVTMADAPKATDAGAEQTEEKAEATATAEGETASS